MKKYEKNAGEWMATCKNERESFVVDKHSELEEGEL